MNLRASMEKKPMRIHWTKLFVVTAGFALLAACGETLDEGASSGGASEQQEGEGVYEYVPAGKLDNYRSTSGREYRFVGLDTITLTGEDAELEGEGRSERVDELVDLKFKAISYFMYAYLADKSSDDDNYGYGGFRTTVRQKTFESLEITQREEEPNTYEFRFEAEAGGPDDLLGQLPIDSDGTFDLAMPVLSNSDLDSGSYTSTYDHFDASEYDEEELTNLELQVEPQDSEPDAYPEYEAMFEDGLLDIAIHVGGDYNDARYDIQTARDLFERLQTDLGLESPVERYEDLRSDSGPFTGTFEADGETIDIEVTLIHPDMQEEPGVGYQGLLDLYRESAATHDIVFYDGHAGYSSSYSGVVVHYNPRHAIPADEFDELELPEKPQLFVFNGCKTYTSYADAMYDHPLKTGENLDVVTTVNFSWLSEMTRITTDFLTSYVDTSTGTHAPRSYDFILDELNRQRSWDVIYGVHGLRDNPRQSPYADEAELCQPCESSSDCPGVDNLCVQVDGGRACTMACTADSGCPDGYSCRSVAQSGSDVISAQQCVPTAGSCGGI